MPIAAFSPPGPPLPLPAFPPFQVVTVPSLTGFNEGVGWQIVPGVRLVVDEGPNQEFVTVFPAVAGDPPNSFRARFYKAHAPGFVISNTILGNPGPQANFNRNNRRYAQDVLSNPRFGYNFVVRYARVLE